MIYRLGGRHRATLLKESPQAYYLVKEEDQKEIDAAYGRLSRLVPAAPNEQPAGRTNIRMATTSEPKYLRAKDGTLAPNSESERKEIEEFEHRTRYGIARSAPHPFSSTDTTFISVSQAAISPKQAALR